MAFGDCYGHCAQSGLKRIHLNMIQIHMVCAIDFVTLHGGTCSLCGGWAGPEMSMDYRITNIIVRLAGVMQGVVIVGSSYTDRQEIV